MRTHTHYVYFAYIGGLVASYEKSIMMYPLFIFVGTEVM